MEIGPPKPLRAPTGPMSVTADIWPHPVTEEGRETRVARVRPGTTLAQLLAEHFADLDPEMEILVDGAEVPAPAWGSTELRTGTIVTMRAAAQGGNPFRALLQIAVIIASVYIPGAIGLQGFWAAAATAGIQIAGNLLINALVPIRAPDLGGGSQAEPVYSLTGGSNRSRLYEAMPLVLGEHRVFPDLGAKGYTEFDGNEQYFHQIFNFGFGDLDVSDIRIGGQPIGDFQEVTTEWGNTQGRVALVAGNVDTTAGAALEDTDWVTRRTGPDTTRAGIDITGRLFRLTDRGDYREHSVDVEFQYEKDGVAPVTRTETISHDDQTPYRKTFRIDFPSAGRWTVRVRRTTERSDNSKIYDELTWAALRSYQPDTGTYGGETRLGMRIRASGQLQGRLDRVSALVRQKIPVWDAAAEAWGEANVASGNPAAVFRAYARGFHDGEELVAGPGIADERIDHAGLGRWYEWCEAQGLRFDMPTRPGMTDDAMLSLIAQCGRGAKSWGTGKLGVVYEDETREPTGFIHPGNIVKGSFRVEYASGTLADEVAVRYIEPDLDWQYNTVRRTRPGLVGSPQKIATVTAQGVTRRENAARECNLQVASHEYHRRRLHWEMGREGRTYRRGDVVWASHSLLDGGIAGRLAAGAGTALTLDREVELDGDDWMLLRGATGQLHQSRVSRPAGVDGPTAEVVLADLLPDGFVGEFAPDVLWRLYDNTLAPAKLRIIGVRPRSDRRFQFIAIDEVAAYHQLATSDLTAPFPDARDSIPRVVAVQFSSERIRVGEGFMIRLRAALTVSGDWRGAVVRAGPDADSLEVVDVLVERDLVAEWLIPEGVGQAVEIIPGSELAPAGPAWRGTWGRESIAPPAMTDGDVVEAEGNIRKVTGTLPVWPDLAGVLVRYTEDPAAAWEAMTPLTAGPIRSLPYLTPDPPDGTYRFVFRTVTTSGIESESYEITRTLTFRPLISAGAVRPADPPGGAIHINPDGTIVVWNGTSWVDQGVDLTGPANARVFLGHVAAGASPTIDGQVEGSVFIAYDGRFWGWEVTAGVGSWVYRGDLTGADGDDGKGIEFVFRRTSTATRPSTPTSTTSQRARDDYVPTGWSDNAQGTTSTSPYEWASRRIRPTGQNQSWSNFGTPALWGVFSEDGEDGIDGSSIEFVFRRTTTVTRPARPFSSTANRQIDDFVPTGWDDDAQGTSSAHPYEWVSKRVRARGSSTWTEFSQPALWGVFSEDGEDGIDGSSIEFVFRRTASALKPGTPFSSPSTDGYVPTGWDDDAQDPTAALPYVWVAKRVRARGGTVWTNFASPTLWAIYAEDGEDGLPGDAGADGKGREFIFRVTTTATRPSTPSSTTAQRNQDDFVPTGWLDDAPDVSDSSKYLWWSARVTTATGSPKWTGFTLPRRIVRQPDDGMDGAPAPRQWTLLSDTNHVVGSSAVTVTLANLGSYKNLVFFASYDGGLFHGSLGIPVSELGRSGKHAAHRTGTSSGSAIQLVLTRSGNSLSMKAYRGGGSTRSGTVHEIWGVNN